MSKTDVVAVTTVVAVDPSTAFRIFTAETKQWWRPRVRQFPSDRSGVLEFEPRVGGRVLEVYADAADEPFVVGRILTWQPGERLRFEWRQTNFQAGQVTQVDIRFESVPEGTRVTLEHSGWDAFPPSHPARHGWTGDAFTGMLGLRWADLLTEFRAEVRTARAAF